VWLTQARALLNALDIATTKGARPRHHRQAARLRALRRCALAAFTDGRRSGAFTPEATLAAGHANTTGPVWV
jgi:hypothetical protein